MGRLSARLVRWLRTWDRPSQMALGLALLFLLISVFLAAFGSGAIRQAALVSAAGLFILMQGIILWGNRGMVTPYTQAQRHFLAGDFDSARLVLESLRDTGKADADALTLLGNTYRQLGRLDNSETVLRQAIVMSPSHHFSLYGFGRTLQAKGDYAQAAQVLQNALTSGAPPLVQFDLGEIHFRQGLYDEAKILLQAAKPHLQEPYRVLMADYLLYRLGTSTPPNGEQIRQGLPYWQAYADKFRDTPYGAALAEDIRWLQKESQA